MHKHGTFYPGVGCCQFGISDAPLLCLFCFGVRDVVVDVFVSGIMQRNVFLLTCADTCSPADRTGICCSGVDGYGMSLGVRDSSPLLSYLFCGTVRGRSCCFRLNLNKICFLPTCIRGTLCNITCRFFFGGGAVDSQPARVAFQAPKCPHLPAPRLHVPTAQQQQQQVECPPMVHCFFIVRERDW